MAEASLIEEVAEEDNLGLGETLVTDYDRDSIHTLPLAYIPTKTEGLRRARMIKNVRLENKIELYREAGAGSAQIDVEEVPDFFQAAEENLVEDMQMLKALEGLKSFDVYSLRRSLRAVGIRVEEQDAFRLSDAKAKELFPFMQNLTRPLIGYIYGSSDDVDLTDPTTLFEMVANPNSEAAIYRLKSLAEALGSNLTNLPSMLEDFGDTFMSLSYYKGYFQYVVPRIEELIEWMTDVRDNSYLRNDQRLVKKFNQVEGLLGFISKSVALRFDNFDAKSVIKWDEITVEEYKEVQELIKAHQETFGEVLCGITVKIYEWENAFPTRGGSPDKRSEFITAEIAPGLDELAMVEKNAPKIE